MKKILLSLFIPLLLWTMTRSQQQTDSSPKKKRVPWTTSKITGSLEPPPPYTIERVFSQLELTNPTVLTNAPDSDRLFITELRGKIYSFPSNPDKKEVDLFYDVNKHHKDIEPRVYGLTFHPQFKTNRLCYLCYITHREIDNGTRVSRFKVTKTDPPRIIPESEEILFTWRSGGHNGGCLKFGPDGYLYITTGDAGPAFPPDPKKTGQDISDLPASILRIDVDHPGKDKLYSIPKDNPFINQKNARPEIWAYGLRNPWKMSFDPKTDHLWVGDVGWELWEMIYRIERGGNYGWSLVEGPQEVHRERPRGPTPILAPTTVHSHTESRSITGGYVYHGDRLKDLQGYYIYGDYVTGKIWGLKMKGDNVISRKELAQTSLQIIAFGIDNDQELYIVGYDGTIYRMEPNKETQANQKFPKRLSETGLFASVKEHTPAAGVYPYSIKVEPWADYATSERWVALPNLSKIGIHKKNEVWMGRIKDEWAFPKDSVLLKTYSIEMEQGNPASRRRIETQILHHDGITWQGYNYLWNDAQTDAVLLEDEGKDHTFTITDANAPGKKRIQTWHSASRTECLLCHTTRTGSILGFKPNQINETHLSGIFKEDNKHKKLPTVAALNDTSASLETRARSYLHINCAHCHHRGGGGTAAMEVPIHLPLKRTRMIDERPTQGTFAMHSARVVASGDPYRSVLYYRMAKLGPGRMPHFGSNVVHQQGLELINDWIQSLPVSSTNSVSSIRRQQREALKQGDIDNLLSTTSGALMLMRAIDQGNVPKEKVIAKITLETPGHIRDLFERYLPPEQRVKRLGSNIQASTIFKLSGDPRRGRALFFESKTLQCRNCHRIQNIGGEIGPDLSDIGSKLNREQLLESILAPSKTIDPKFVTWLVETNKGQVHTGLMRQRDDKLIVLRNAQGKDQRIAVQDVDLIAPQQKSLMPELLLRDLTAQQASDLLAFLRELKTQK